MKITKKVLAVAALSAVVLGGSGSTLVFMFNNGSSGGINVGKPGNGGNTLTEHEKEVLSIKEKLFENLSGSNLKINNLDLTCDNLGGSNKQLAINYKGAVDYLGFIESGKTNITTDDIAAKFNANLNVKYLNNNADAKYQTQLDENLSVQTQGNGKLYINWLNQGYTMSGKIINDVIDFLPTITKLTGVDLSSVEQIKESIKKLDLVTLLPIACNVLGSISGNTDIDQEAVNGIYTFKVEIPASIVASAGIDQGITITLKCDTNGLLTQLSITPLTVSGITIGLNAVTEMSLENSYVQDVNDSEYGNNLDCTTNMLTTIASLINEKKFNSTYSIGLNESVGGVKVASHSFEGNIKGDLTNATTINDVKNAKFDLSLNQNASFNSNINIKYDNNATYFKVNNNTKGFIANSTIDELITNISSTVKDPALDQGSGAVNTILQDSAIYEIMNGNWSAYKKFIKSLTVTDEIMTLSINAKAFVGQLPDADFTLNIDLSNNKLNSISIKDLPFKAITKTDGKDYLDTVDFTLSLADFDSFSPDYGDLTSYPDFKVINPLYNTIKSIVDTNTVGVNYSVGLSDTSNSSSYNINGTIDADFSKATTLDFGTINSVDSAITAIKGQDLGLYGLTAHSKVNGIAHNVKMTYQEQGMYLDYQGASEKSRTRMSLKQASLFNIFDVVNGLLNNGNTSSTADSSSASQFLPFNDINSALTEILDISNGKIWTLLNGDQILKLDEYFSVSKNADGLLNIAFDTNYFGKDYGKINVVLDSNTSSLTSINANLLKGTTNVSFALDFKTFASPLISETEITDFYKEMDTSVQAIVDILSLSSGAMKVDGTLSAIPRQ